MKWKIINNGFSPQFKCGAETAIGLGVGIASLAGSLYSTGVSQSNVSSQLGAQEQENQKNRDWQTAEAEKARQFSAQQQSGAFSQVQQLQSQQQQYNLQSMAQQAKYNSPVYQRQQLEAAGINPQVYFGQNASFAGSSAQTGGAPSAPAPAHGVMPGSVSGLSPVGFQPPYLDVAAIGNAMKNIAEAKKLGVETEWLPATLEADIMNKKSYVDLNSTLALGQKIHNVVQQSKMPYEVKKAELDVYKSVAEINLLESKNVTEQSIQKVNESIAKLNDALEKVEGLRYQEKVIFLKYYENNLIACINNLKSDTALKVSEAQKNIAEIQTEDELRQWRVNLAKEDINKVRSEIRKIDIDNKATAIESLRKLTGLSDAVWNDIWNKIKLKTGAVNREALEKYLLEYDLP